MTADALAGRDLETLRAAIAGQVFVPGEAGYDQASPRTAIWSAPTPATSRIFSGP